MDMDIDVDDHTYTLSGSILSIPLPPSPSPPPVSIICGGIPQELVDIIIDFLHADIPSLLACSLVSRAWLSSSRHHLLHTHTILVRHSRRTHEFIGQRELLDFAGMAKNNTVGPFIANLTIQGSTPPLFLVPELDARLIADILAILPNLRTLTLHVVSLVPMSPTSNPGGRMSSWSQAQSMKGRFRLEKLSLKQFQVQASQNTETYSEILSDTLALFSVVQELHLDAPLTIFLGNQHQVVPNDPMRLLLAALKNPDIGAKSSHSPIQVHSLYLYCSGPAKYLSREFLDVVAKSVSLRTLKSLEIAPRLHEFAVPSLQPLLYEAGPSLLHVGFNVKDLSPECSSVLSLLKLIPTANLISLSLSDAMDNLQSIQSHAALTSVLFILSQIPASLHSITLNLISYDVDGTVALRMVNWPKLSHILHRFRELGSIMVHWKCLRRPKEKDEARWKVFRSGLKKVVEEKLPELKQKGILLVRTSVEPM